jgi:hypothetical protein
MEKQLAEGYIVNAQEDIEIANEGTILPEEPTESVPEYALATSKEGLGELCPVLKDKFGNIIDGYHRKGENANWREETCDWIDTPEKLEAARLAVNFARRRMAPEEIKERVTYLVSKAKMSTEQIAKLTGIAERTVRKYMPQEFKNAAKVEAGQLGNEARKVSAVCMPHNKIPDTASTPSTACTEPRYGEKVDVDQPEPEEIPEDCPICPLCSASMDVTEFQEIKKKAKTKYGTQIQTLLFSPIMEMQ